MAERLLTDIAAGASQMTFAILRYFNVAGADPEARIGEATPDNNHLVKIALETALGHRNSMTINGTDYPTEDGTCIRDYIHVEDLAAAHVAALKHLRERQPIDGLQLRLRPRPQRPRGDRHGKSGHRRRLRGA